MLSALNWSVKHGVALEQWLHSFGLLTMANLQHSSWASRHLPLGIELHMLHSQFGSWQWCLQADDWQLVLLWRSHKLPYPGMPCIPPWCWDVWQLSCLQPSGQESIQAQGLCSAPAAVCSFSESCLDHWHAELFPSSSGCARGAGSGGWVPKGHVSFLAGVRGGWGASLATLSLELCLTWGPSYL